MTAAHHDQRRRGGEPFHEHLGLVVDGHRFVGAHGRHASADLQGRLVQGRRAHAAGDGSVGPQQQLCPQARRSAFRPHDGGQGRRLRAVIRSQYLVADVGEVIDVPERLQVEVHSSAADQAVAGRDVLVQVVVLELGAALVAQDLARGEPDIAFDAPSAQRAHGGAVFPHQQHRS